MKVENTGVLTFRFRSMYCYFCIIIVCFGMLRYMENKNICPVFKLLRLKQTWTDYFLLAVAYLHVKVDGLL